VNNLICPKCNKEYIPLLRVRDGELFCLNCEKFTILTDLNEIQSTLKISKAKDKNKLIYKIKKIKYPINFFLLLLLYQNDISCAFHRLGYYPMELVQRWMFSQYLLELIYNFRVKDMEYKDVVDIELDENNFEESLDSYFQLVEKSISYDRYYNEIIDGSVIHADYGSSTDLYITKKKKIFGTPLYFISEITRRNSYNYDNFNLESKGYSPNILKTTNPTFQEWSLSAGIYAAFVKYMSLNFIDVNELKHPELTYLIIHTFYKHFKGSQITFYEELSLINEVFYKDVTQKFLKDLITHGFFLPKAYTSEEFDDCYNDLIQYFSKTGVFRKIFFSFKDLTIFSFETLKLFEQLIESQYQIFFNNERWNIRTYRAITNFEKEIWRFGFHFNVQHIFNDKEPMMSKTFSGPEGDFEFDAVFYNDGTLNLIECKSDIAIDILTQENYYRKLYKKIQPLGEYFKSKGLYVTEIIPSLVCQVCATTPPEGLNVFLTEIHFVESFSRKYGLFEWDGDKFFDKFPLIARIGWENARALEHIQMDLEHILPDSNLILIRGEYKGSYLSFIDRNTESKYRIKIEISDDRYENWEELPVLLIWNANIKEIEDFLFLPPYWNEVYSDDNYWTKLLPYHDSQLGQRFLHIAVKNGAFGYCPECEISPLVPKGFWYKPARFDAIGKCLICKNEFDIYKFDKSSFSENDELFDKAKKSLKYRLDAINIKI